MRKKLYVTDRKEVEMGLLDPFASGEQIRYYRRKCELSQEDLSAIFEEYGVSVSRNSISNWETGKKPISRDNAMLLAGIFGCEISELLISRRRAAELRARG